MLSFGFCVKFNGLAGFSDLPTSRLHTMFTCHVFSPHSRFERSTYKRPAIKGRRFSVVFWGLLCLSGFVGCGATKSYTATEQLLMSDAVDASVAKLDFQPLSGKKVYLDATYIKTVRSPLLIDSDYVISSLRQQMVGAGVQLTEARDQADLIAEARLGALGMDGHQVTYGLPASNALSQASSALGAPLLPSLPEVAFARHEAKSGAAKIAVFAFERESRQPYWQSGISKSASSAQDTWIMGVGPWQRGTIYEGTRFAGASVDRKTLLGRGLWSKKAETEFRASEEFAKYYRSQSFEQNSGSEPTALAAEGSPPLEEPADPQVVAASASEPAS